MFASFATTANARKVYWDLVRNDKGETLEARLTSIAVREGLDYAQAHQATQDILDVLYAHQLTFDTAGVIQKGQVDDLLLWVDRSLNREKALNQLYTGLKIASLPASKFNCSSIFINEDVQRIQEECLEIVKSDYQKARAEIREAFQRLNLEEKRLKQLMDKISYDVREPDAGIQTNADALRQHLSINAFSAMRMYLANSETLTPHESAVLVSTHKIAAAFHEEISAGCDSKEEMSEFILSIALLTALEAAVVLLCMPFALEVAPMLLSFEGLAATVVIVSALVKEPVSKVFGAMRIHLFSETTALLDAPVNAEAPEETVDCPQEKAFSDPLELFDVQSYEAWDEITDNALVY